MDSPFFFLSYEDGFQTLKNVYLIFKCDDRCNFSLIFYFEFFKQNLLLVAQKSMIF